MNAPRSFTVARRAAFLLCLTVLLPARQAAAQNPDPAREIQELAKRIDDQLKEIDRLLLDSGKKNQAREKPKEMLQQSVERSREVATGIDELIEKLNEMKNQSSSGQGESQDQKPQDQQDQQQQQQQQQGQQQRRENQNPDFVQQPKDGQQQPGQEQGKQPQGQQPKPGEGQQQKPQGQNPQDGQEQKTAGENKLGKQPPPSETGPGNPGTGSESWGELQGYTNFLKNRGSPPKVPEKYRKYWEAYLKSKQGTGPTGGGSTGNGK